MIACHPFNVGECSYFSNCSNKLLKSIEIYLAIMSDFDTNCLTVVTINKKIADECLHCVSPYSELFWSAFFLHFPAFDQKKLRILTLFTQC